MKAISFNVNSVRQRLHQLQALIDNHAPDVLGLQETKVTDEDFPLAQIQAMGYNAIFTGQKTHYGVALLIKAPLAYSNSFLAFDNAEDDAQKRIIGADITLKSGKTVSVINGYFPQGEAQDHPVKFPAKQEFYEDLQAHLNNRHSPDSPLIVMGDMNISPTDLDIGIGEDNRKRWLRTGKCSFLPVEREWINRLYGWGLTDTYRHQNPECSEFYSWFDYRSRGFEREPKRGLRIDLILATKPLLNTLKSTGIDYEVRGLEKPSDHAPIWAEFDY